MKFLINKGSATFFLCLLIYPLFSQDTTSNWSHGGGFNLNIAQVGLKNWVGGGQNSLSVTALQTYYVTLDLEKVKWQNQLDMGFGLLRQGRDPNFYKSDDKLIFVSKLNRVLREPWYLTGLVDFRTQFAPGYEYSTGPLGERQRQLISRFMAPGYLVVSPGVEYKLKDIFYLMASPFSGKFTFVLDDSLAAAGAFGVQPNERIREEIGAFLIAGINKNILENVTLNTKVSLFSSYSTFGNIDVNWELTLLMKVNKYITTTLSTQLIYDDDIKITRDDGTVGRDVQFKEVINIGLLYQFGSESKSK